MVAFINRIKLFIHVIISFTRIKNYLIFRYNGTICSDATVYRTIHDNMVIKTEESLKNINRIYDTFFSVKKGENGMSVDLDFLSTPEQSRRRRDNSDNPINHENISVLGIKVSEFIKRKMNIQHDPIEDNVSHALIHSDTKKMRCSRGGLQDVSKWILKSKYIKKH